MVQTQADSISKKELRLLDKMRETVYDRQRNELATTERLTTLILEAIENCIPIREEWLLAPDALAICQNHSVIPEIPSEPVPIIDVFPDDRLNEEQVEVAHDMLKNLQVGKVVLEEDLENWIKLCSNPIGPLGCSDNDGGRQVGLTLPKKWRENESNIRRDIIKVKGVPGIDESSGIMPLETLMTHLQCHIQK